jgi:hypothetical protein
MSDAWELLLVPKSAGDFAFHTAWHGFLLARQAGVAASDGVGIQCGEGAVTPPPPPAPTPTPSPTPGTGSDNPRATIGGCSCQRAWAVNDNTCTDGEVEYSYCGMLPSCDGDGSQFSASMSWCIIDAGCANPAGENWDYCDTASAAPVAVNCVGDFGLWGRCSADCSAGTQVRKTPSWPRSWANFSRL